MNGRKATAIKTLWAGSPAATLPGCLLSVPLILLDEDLGELFQKVRQTVRIPRLLTGFKTVHHPVIVVEVHPKRFPTRACS